MLPDMWKMRRNAPGSVEEADKCYRPCGGGGEMLPVV